MTDRRVLVTGGVRSGKSRFAEALLASAASVTYLATGPVPDPDVDADWAARIAAHRARRPGSWSTVETRDAAAVLRGCSGPVLLDCLGTWLTGQLDDLDAWQRPLPDWHSTWSARMDDLVAAWAATTGLTVGVTNEVGWGVVPPHASGRLFADLLGLLNQRVAAASDEVIMMVAGRPLRL